MNKQRHKKIQKIVELLVSGDYKAILEIAEGNLQEKDFDFAIKDYSEATGMTISPIPPEGYEKAWDYPHEDGDHVGDDGVKWDIYVLPLWFNNKETDLVLETITTDTGDDVRIFIKDVLVK